MKVIITGAGGMLGRRLAAEARRAGHETIGVGRAAHPPAGSVCDRWISGDLADPRMLEQDWASLSGAAVFHLAADTRIYQPGRDFVRDNVATTETACAMAQRTGGRLIFFSSSAVYSGPHTRRPVTALAESDETNPSTAYGRSKRMAEGAISRAGVDAVVLRLFGVLSDLLPAVPERGNLVQAIVRAWRTGGEVVVATDASGELTVRDYVLEEDVSRCALAALVWPRAAVGPLTVNVCTGEGTTAVAMVEMARKVAGKEIRLRLEPHPAGTNPAMVGDPSTLRKLHSPAPQNRVWEFWAKLFSGRRPAP